MTGIKVLLCLKNENNKDIQILITLTDNEKVTLHQIKIIENKNGNRKKLNYLCVCVWIHWSNMSLHRIT